MTPIQVVELIDKIILQQFPSVPNVGEYALTALLKLSVRFQHDKAFSKISTIMQRYQKELDVEIQQRAVEFHSMLHIKDTLPAVLERMPIPEIKEDTKEVQTGIRDIKTPAKSKESTTDVSTIRYNEL